MSGTSPRIASHETAVVGGIVAGVVFSLIVTLYADSLGYPVFQFNNPIKVYPFIILLTSGFIAMYSALRYSVLSPSILLVVGTLLWKNSESNPGPGDPFIGFIYLLQFLTIAMLVTGVIEFRVRAYFN